MPGERVQLDTVKVAPGIYQYTAVDEHSRFLVAEIYPRANAKHTLDFLELLLDAYVVPIQRIQTDRGSEFMAEEVQNWLKAHFIKYRPNKPGSPHLNGKVERAQRTMLEEFYAATDLKSSDLASVLGEWIIHYNYQRIHGSFGATPIDRFCSKLPDVPTWEEIAEQYDPNKERLRVHDYELDQRLAHLQSPPQTIFSDAESPEKQQGAQTCQGRRAKRPLTRPSTLLQSRGCCVGNVKDVPLKRYL